MKVRSKAGLRGGWAVLALTVVALQACAAETEGPQPSTTAQITSTVTTTLPPATPVLANSSTTVRAPSTVAAPPPPATPTLANSSTTTRSPSTVTTVSSASVSSLGGTDDAPDQVLAVGPETSLAVPPPPDAGPDEAQAAARPSPMDRPPVSYLEEVIPPCTPIEGSEEETCRSGFSLDNIGQNIGGYYIEIMSVSSTSLGEIDVKLVGTVHGDFFYETAELNPTISQIVAGESRLVSYPHVVIRGTTRPHTTRCEKYPWRIPDTVWLDYLCFVDVRVNEYIIGRGPPDLTIAVYEEMTGIRPRKNWILLPNEWLDYTFNNPALRTAEAYEGREMIMLLDIPYKSSVETLQVAGVYFVLEPKDGNTSVGPLHADGLDLNTVNHATDLVDLVQQYREAAGSRDPSSYNPALAGPYSPPVLVDDANYLQDIYQIWAAEEEARGDIVMDYLVLPPPPPSAEIQP